MFALKNILVATDFSDHAAAALAYGRELARQYGATLHVFTAVDDVAARYSGDFAPMFTTDLQRDLEQTTEERLNQLLTPDDRRLLHARSTAITALSPAPAIVEYAKRNAIDLIVVGTHGRGAMGHLFLGSVAERVVRTAPCPVLTVRHGERDFIASDAATAAARV